MEDTWLYIDDDDDSYHSASDSDIVDSETEAELYSTIHYEENLNSNNTDGISFLTSKQFADSNSEILTPKESVFCTVENGENVNTQLMGVSSFISNNLLEEDKKSPNKRTFLNSELKQDLNTAKKLKLDSTQEIESVNFGSCSSQNRNLNESSEHMLMSNVQSEIGRYKQFSLKKDTFLVDSSDSDDNIIWTTENSSEKADFKTNVADFNTEDVNDTIFLNSSDSDSELPISPAFKKRESILKNLSMPNIKMGENYEGLWQINDEDLYRQRKYSRRYHENIEVTCTNCNKKGHSFRTCTVPKKIKCFICGGAHLGSRCMNRICSNCYEYGHDRKRCQMKPNNSRCSLCARKGHFMEDCPDLWRRYHLTTQPVKIIRGKTIKQDSRDLYCWNCGSRGHFGAHCQLKYSNNLTTWPCVISYNDPEKVLRRRMVHDVRQNDHVRWKERLKNQSFNNSRRNYACLKQIELDTTADANGGQRLTGRREKARKRMDMRFKKVKKILGEQDFPRTPKQGEPKIRSEVPESVQLTAKQQLARRKRNLKRRLKRQQKANRANAQNLQAVV